MKSRKSSGKGKPSGKRAVKDLAPRKSQTVKGGAETLSSSVQKKAADTLAGQQAKVG